MERERLRSSVFRSMSERTTEAGTPYSSRWMMERANFSMSSGGSAVLELPAGVGSGVEDVLLIDPPEA